MRYARPLALTHGLAHHGIRAIAFRLGATVAFLTATLTGDRTWRFEDPVAEQIADRLSSGDGGFIGGFVSLKAFRRVALKVLEETQAAGRAVERIEHERLSLAAMLAELEPNDDWTVVWLNYNVWDD